NHPNPFNPATTLSFSLPGKSHVSLSIFDVEGRLVRTLVNEVLTGGFKAYEWNGNDNNGISVSSGVYFYRLRAGDKTLTKKMVLIK
ncbi:MAG: T9SS type A sorting domain-containing protein, partial [Candidatus Latescibacteria bacterium]|nr:T9SS type A sorting domain-containing protein [Candidatus Latescibacterota bacterium]NIO56816.1 T9SS type A sorting domain-containing protein [Candidatus Latescibacterota bacterium]